VTGATFDVRPSPVGDLLIAASERGVCLISWGDHEAALARLEAEHGSVDRGSPLTHAAGQQLDEYFGKGRRSFDLPLDLSGASAFCRSVLELLAGLPYGDLTSYGELAGELGSAPRAVGRAVGSNPVPVVVPCHRVVAADGTLGGYGGGLQRKRTLLALEGHEELPGGWEPRGRRPTPRLAARS
jgi:methylated-DNA-[protein]-cysteine S-methyltransferase